MYRSHFDSFDSSEAADAATEVVRLLRQGGIGVVPTETVPGLVCMWTGPESVAKLQQAKGRDANQKCQFLIGSVSHAEQLGVVDTTLLDAVSEKFWPGPLTAIVDTKTDTAGLRLPDSPWLRSVINGLGAPLVASSANPPGVDPTVSAAQEYRDLPQQLDFIISGPTGVGVASTVCRLRPFEILRAGPVDELSLRLIICPEVSAG